MAMSETKRRLLIAGVLIGGATGFATTCVLLHLSVWFGLIAVIPGIGLAILEYMAIRGNTEAELSLRSAWSITLVGAVLIWLPMMLVVIGNSAFAHFPGQHLNWIAVLVWPVGWLAFRFKQYNSAYYGTVEIIVGVVTAFATALRGQFGPVQGIAVLGAMYVVSRGYGNVADAAKRKDEIERNAQAFRDYRGRCKRAAASLWDAIMGRPRKR